MRISIGVWFLSVLSGFMGFHRFSRRATIRNSTLPSAPVTGLGSIPITCQQSMPATQASMRAQTARCNSGSRTMPAFADLALPDFELRLDQRGKMGAGGGKTQRRRQDFFEPDKARVADDDIDRFGDVLVRHVARVETFEHDHAVVAAQFPVQLPVADVDGVDFRRAAAEQNIGKPASRRADVERNRAGHIDIEMAQRVIELEPAARYPRMFLAADL